MTGKPSKTSPYLYISLDYKSHLAHRLAWFYVHGEWPHAEIDHIDGNKTNNALANLRLATSSQNNMNMGRSSANTSGFKGVTWHAQKRRWQAQIKSPATGYKYLGLYDTAEEAHAVYVRAAQLYHGEYARHD